tara:strand:- start:350 stop:478 length:129 start_codon:yes stop_codon:yes gene_type:complete
MVRFGAFGGSQNLPAGEPTPFPAPAIERIWQQISAGIVVSAQ